MKTPPRAFRTNFKKLDCANLRIEFEHAVPASVFSSLFHKFIYYILNMKNQIPYPVGHLYNLWKRESERSSKPPLEGDKQICERDAISAYETMNEIQKHLLLEFQGGTVEEIVLVIGSSVMLAKDVYRFVLPACLVNCVENSSHRYYDKCHAVLLKRITECTDLQDILMKTYAPTKIFFFLKKKSLPLSEHLTQSDWLLPIEDLNLYPMKSNATIEFAMKPQVEMPKFNVFEDSLSPDGESIASGINDTDVLKSLNTSTQELSKWYQSSLHVNGFKPFKEKTNKTHTFIKFSK